MQKHDIRFKILALAVLSMGNYYVQDIPAVTSQKLKDQFVSQGYSTNRAEQLYAYQYMYYAMAACLTNMIFGLLGDIIGYSKMQIIVCFLMFIGQIINLISTYYLNPYGMIIARFVLGMGIENFNCIQQAIVIFYFQSKESFSAYALYYTFMKIAQLMNLLITPHVTKYGLMYPQYLASFWILTSITSTLIFVKLNNPIQEDKLEWPSDLWFRLKRQLKMISTMSSLFFFLQTIVFLVYFNCYSIIPYLPSIITDVFLDPNLSQHQKELITSHYLMLYYIPILLMPIIGLMIDKIGQRVKLLIFSQLLALSCYLCMLQGYLIPSLLLLGASYTTMNNPIFLSSSSLVTKRQLSVSQGFVCTILNLSYFVNPLIITNYKQYGNKGPKEQGLRTIHLMIFASVFTILVVLIFKIVDFRQTVSLDNKQYDRIVNHSIAEKGLIENTTDQDQNKNIISQ